MPTSRYALAAVALVGLLARPATAAPITDLLVFGDSLSDTGNAFLGTGGTTPPSPPYFDGRFSNGPVWVERLAGRLGVTAPTPAFAGGSNYAVGGAETGTGLSPIGAPGVLEQVDTYLNLTPFPADPPSPGTLIVLQGGGNDFLNGQTDPTVPVANLLLAVTELAGSGGTRFAVANLPDLGELPGTNTLPAPARAALNALSATFNALLAQELAQLAASLGVRIDLIDVNGLYAQIRANPAAFGFTNVTQGSLLNADPTGAGYLFWDELHPTTAAHDLLAARAFGSVTLVPEPASVALLAVGGVAVAVRRRFRSGERGA